jgi:ABC-type nitrate/sulfonate/bicarbonate transport system permease component
VGILLLLAVWQALTGVVARSSLPTPLSVAIRIRQDFIHADQLSFYGLNTGLFDSMAYTATNVAAAVLMGAFIGAPLGLLTARFRLLRALVDPVLMTAGTIPIIVLAPFFLIWFGVDRISAMLLVAIFVTVILYVYAQRAADNIDPVYEDSAATLGASRARVVRDVLLPGTVPQILGGVRIALAGAWGLEAIAELMGAQYGIGKIVQLLAGATDVGGIFACLLVLGVVAVLCDVAAAWAITRLAAWNQPARTGAE